MKRILTVTVWNFFKGIKVKKKKLKYMTEKLTHIKT